jgi:hypothetical protein
MEYRPIRGFSEGLIGDSDSDAFFVMVSPVRIEFSLEIQLLCYYCNSFHSAVHPNILRKNNRIKLKGESPHA